MKLFFKLIVICTALSLLSTTVLAQVVDCEQPLEIWQVQSSGNDANCIRDRVMLQNNIVTGVGASGFFIQTPVDRVDGDDATSDGVFVYTNVPGAAFGVQVGDLVHVEGRVMESYNMTQIEVSGRRRVEIVSSNNPIPEAINLFDVQLDWIVGEDIHPLERYEGMLVRVENARVVAPTNYFDEFGISLTGLRAFREAGLEIDLMPDFAGQGLPEADLNPELLEVDPPEMGLDVEFVTVESTVTVVGGLAYSYQDYQIWPVELTINLADYAIRPVRDRLEGEFTIATQNMYNLFDTVDDPYRVDGTTEDYVPLNSNQYQLFLRKMSEQVRVNLGAPDILAIQEIENARVLTDLALQIYEDDSSLRYTSCFQEGNDDRGIDNAFLVRTDRVNLISCYRLPGSLTAPASVGGGRLFGRPPLVLEAQIVTDGQPFAVTLINLHIKSLSGIEADTVQIKRMDQAMMVASYVQQLLNEDPDAHVVVLGDLNAFEVTDGLVDVVGILTGDFDAAGARFAPEFDTLEPNLVNQVLRVPREDRYSYIFNSTSQVLDHIITSPALNAYVTDAQYSRGNADALYYWDVEDNGALRSSDHDGFVVFINPTLE